MTMVLVWRSFGGSELFEIKSGIPMSEEDLSKLKTRILKTVETWNIDTSGLESTKSWAGVFTWVRNNCREADEFEGFEMCCLEDL